MNKKKILIIALALALCTATFVSCGGNQGEGSDGSESGSRTEEKNTEAGDKKSMDRGMGSITGRITDGIENVGNGVVNGVENVKNGVMNGIGSVKRDTKKGIDNVRDSIVEGSIDTEDATHGIEEKPEAEADPGSANHAPGMHRRAVPNSK